MTARISLILSLMLTFCLYSCDNSGDKKRPCPVGCGTEGHKPCPKNCEPKEAVVEEVKVNNINFYLENSGSMGGYLNGATEFKNVITNLVAVTNGMAKSGKLNISTISEKREPYAGDHNKFIKDIATVPMANKKSSEMHKIFDLLVKDIPNKDVVIFTSDCILSFPDVDIKKNPRVNIDNAESTLKAYIKSTFQGFQQRGLVASMYAFNSAFNGTYYDYKNTKVPLTGKQRPFYIWVMGKKEYVAKVNEMLRKESSFKPVKEIHFGFLTQAISDYAVIPSLASQKEYRVQPPYKEVSEVSITKTKPQDIFVALNLDGVDTYATAPEYLKANLAIPAGSKVTAEVMEVKNAMDMLNNIKNVKERDMVANKYTHIVRLKVTGLVGTKAELNLQLPYKADNWFELWSTMDDSNIKTEASPKTFAFIHLVNGIKEAYQMNSNQANVLDLKVNFSK
jgi:hypothetical protein